LDYFCSFGGEKGPGWYFVLLEGETAGRFTLTVFLEVEGLELEWKGCFFRASTRAIMIHADWYWYWYMR